MTIKSKETMGTSNDIVKGRGLDKKRLRLPAIVTAGLASLALSIGCGEENKTPTHRPLIETKSNTTSKKIMKETLRPTAVELANRALKLSKGPDALFQTSPYPYKIDKDMYPPKTILIEASRQVGGKDWFVDEVAYIAVGMTNSQPDPRKVIEVSLSEDREDSNKYVIITSPSSTYLYADELADRAWAGFSSSDPNNLDNKPRSFADTINVGTYPQTYDALAATEVTRGAQSLFNDIVYDLKQDQLASLP